ncbi:unnamed protein product, partial [Cyclocybe aegerita]
CQKPYLQLHPIPNSPSSHLDMLTLISSLSFPSICSLMDARTMASWTWTLRTGFSNTAFSPTTSSARTGRGTWKESKKSPRPILCNLEKMSAASTATLSIQHLATFRPPAWCTRTLSIKPSRDSTRIQQENFARPLIPILISSSRGQTVLVVSRYSHTGEID